MKNSTKGSQPQLYVGTCGFSYRDWIGPFYPLGTKSADMLAYYAGSFGTVEIDSTYYAVPKPALFEGMNRRTPPEFRFTVKAPGSITHAPSEIEFSGNDDTTAEATAFRDCLEPIVASGKLGAVLLQFPHAFRPGRQTSRRLEAMRSLWPDLPLVAEFRHREWQRNDSLEFLRELGIGWCNVDEPRFASLMRPGAEVTSPIGYVRFHGRNAGQWWQQDREPGARYDYLYSETELAEWLPRIAEVTSAATETYVFFNNHRLGKAAHNARDMSGLLRLHPPEKPAERELRLF